MADDTGDNKEPISGKLPGKGVLEKGAQLLEAEQPHRPRPDHCDFHHFCGVTNVTK